jgi:hypothetical protein
MAGGLPPKRYNTDGRGFLVGSYLNLFQSPVHADRKDNFAATRASRPIVNPSNNFESITYSCSSYINQQNQQK